ncbi:MAG: AAA family ATPase [Deltaproteobacteria bacterium]|jgi:general secretion pathway protein A|nr:AAA family ATPase [Deltaproteobacteria bacterium]
MDYEKFFKLNQRPFKPTLEAKFFYRTEGFERLSALLQEEILPRVIFLLGAEGSGKSTFVKRLPKDVSEYTRMTPVLDPTVSFTDILRQALNFLGLGYKCPPSAKDEELLGFFQNAVDDSLNDGLCFVLAVDDADHLDDETLRDLLTLSRLDARWEGRVCLLLAGPLPDPRAQISSAPRAPGFGVQNNPQNYSPDYDQDYQWPPEELSPMATTVELKGLNLQETIEFVRHRLMAAGNLRELFSAEAFQTIKNLSHGYPRMINALAEKSLMTAWAAGKPLVTNSHVIQAKANFDKPIAINDQAAKSAAGSERLHHKVSKRSWISLLAAAFIVGIMVWLLWPSTKGQSLSTQQVAQNVVNEEIPLEPGPQATPSAEPVPEGVLGLPSLPPSVVKLPQTGVTLVVENGQKMARLWQGGLDGPGLKAEIAAPDFKDPGLYLVGRPGSRSPIIFRYPPKTELPRTAAVNLWKRVDNLLPQDILPLMVGPSSDLSKSVPNHSASNLSAFLDRWISAQTGKKSKDMADLYADSFSFFEPGHKPVSISKRNLRLTLESEAQAAGEIRLTISDPLIMLDPRDQNRAWIVFTLKYDSKLRHNIGLRTLILEKTRSKDWAIVAELWLKEETVKS